MEGEKTYPTGAPQLVGMKHKPSSRAKCAEPGDGRAVAMERKSGIVAKRCLRETILSEVLIGVF